MVLWLSEKCNLKGSSFQTAAGERGAIAREECLQLPSLLKGVVVKIRTNIRMAQEVLWWIDSFLESWSIEYMYMFTHNVTMINYKHVLYVCYTVYISSNPPNAANACNAWKLPVL